MGACFALKHQRCCREKFHPSWINLKILKELWLQQEIKDAHGNKEAYDTLPVWDSKNCAASANLIEQHFCHIWGMDSALRDYLIHNHAVPPTLTGSSDEQT